MVACEHIADLIPAYALDSLEKDEAAPVKAHLEACENCRSELRAYQAIAGSLPGAVPQYNPPARVKTALFERVQAASAPARPAAPAPAAARPQRVEKAPRRAFPFWALAGLAVMVLLLAGNLLLWREVLNLRASQPEQLGVINLHSAGGPAPEATGLIVVSADRSHGTLVVDRLHTLPEDQQYQLWLIQNGHRVSGGVFSVDDDGYSAMWVHAPEPLGSYDSFGITIEPYGGSYYPTGDKVLGD